MNTTLSTTDRDLLERARELAQRGWGHVHPNPMVGCVIAHDGEVVGEGWHEEFGGAHAEVNALRQAGARAEGATAYVSLEPCNHHGKTPPCVQALAEAGIARVVFGVEDPGEDEGGGAGTLARAGVDVVGPVHGDREGLADDAGFQHRSRTGRPFVAAKLAVSLDGRIAEGPGERTTLTGEAATREVHRLRAGFDAIMVGAETARVDDPLLTVRGVQGTVRPPVRIVLDSTASLPSDAALFDDVESAPVWVFCSEAVDEAELERLEDAGADVHPVPRGPDGLDLHAVVDRADELGVTSILCEGGGRTVASLLQTDLLDRLYLFIAPRLMGIGGVPAFPDGSLGPDWHRAAEPRGLGDDALVIWDCWPGLAPATDDAED